MQNSWVDNGFHGIVLTPLIVIYILQSILFTYPGLYPLMSLYFISLYFSASKEMLMKNNAFHSFPFLLCQRIGQHFTESEFN